ncbi:MAG TPA: hypothetical protein VFB94_26555 [Acidimicrobiales bacterium]|nr:hypothetical protein [Acidimicrobiales bacterium]
MRRLSASRSASWAEVFEGGEQRLAHCRVVIPDHHESPVVASELLEHRDDRGEVVDAGGY